MLSKNSCRMIFISVLVCIISIANFGCAEQTAKQPGVEYVVGPKVTAGARADAEFAIHKTIEFFEQTYGIKLKRNIKVVLAADDAAYKAALIQETGASELEAERRVRNTVAWSSGHKVIRNTAKANDKLNNVFKMSHEIVHQYQEQETGGAGMQLEWFAEGMADVIAAHVTDKAHLMPIDKFKETAQATVRTARSLPLLAELHSPEDFNKALETYGSGITYRSADLGVLSLVEKYGLPQLIEFLRELRKMRAPAAAFQKSFTIDIKIFEEQFTNDLHSLARKAS